MAYGTIDNDEGMNQEQHNEIHSEDKLSHHSIATDGKVVWNAVGCVIA
jgi:hypothetical protein